MDDPKWYLLPGARRHRQVPLRLTSCLPRRRQRRKRGGERRGGEGKCPDGGDCTVLPSHSFLPMREKGGKGGGNVSRVAPLMRPSHPVRLFCLCEPALLLLALRKKEGRGEGEKKRKRAARASTPVFPENLFHHSWPRAKRKKKKKRRRGTKAEWNEALGLASA